MTLQARQDGLLVQEVGDELVIYDQERDIIQALNPTTALVWRHCDGQTNITGLATLLAQELGLPRDEDLVGLALEQLQKAHLLQESESLSHATDAGKVSRREMLHKLQLVAGLALLLPVISSITAPTPAMAVSPGGRGGGPDGGGGRDDIDNVNECMEACQGGYCDKVVDGECVTDDPTGKDNCYDFCERKFP